MTKAIFSLIILLVRCFGIFAQGTVFYEEASWSPDGKYLSCSVYRKADPNDKQLKYEIYIMKADGSDAKKVADNASWSSWSKDGKRFLFSRSSADKQTSDIFTIKKDGSNLIRLTKDASRNSHPAYSPDGKKIAFTSTRDGGKNQIYVMNADDTKIKRLTTDDNVAYLNPKWSQDSKRLVFYAEKGDQKDQIWTINADGSNQMLLTGNIGHNTFPSFSPDGKLVIFSSNRDGEQAIYTMNSADGLTPKRLENVKSFLARFSPNGKKLVLIIGSFPQNDLYIADADGTNQIKITNKTDLPLSKYFRESVRSHLYCFTRSLPPRKPSSLKM